MVCVELRPSMSSAQLREAHQALDAETGGSAELHLGDLLQPLTPGQFSAWMQLVLTWGQNFDIRVLHMTPATADRVATSASLSDIEVMALTLATEVLVEGEPVDAQSKVRDVLVQRNTLTTHDGDGNGPASTILLAAHTFTNRTSPELHAAWEGQMAIEETARTLYHDIYPGPPPQNTLRPALLEFGEETIVTNYGSRVTRTSGPNGPPFTSLGARAPQARGLALELSTAVRVQPKPVRDEIGEILFELVQNTEWHARWAGGSTGANCRIVSFREYRYDRAAMSAAEEFDGPFIAYARAVANEAMELRGGRLHSVRFGAVTVIDSGVGLARSVALSLEEEDLLDENSDEVYYLIRALNKSLRVRRADMGNIGLPRVQQTLTNLRGFMSIRTGSVQILRDFANSPFEPVPDTPGTTPRPLFLDWVPKDEDDFVIGPRIGTAVTIVYPVDFEGSA